MKKILLIEDDVFLNQLYTDLLKQGKYAVTSVTDGTEGYKQVSNGTWDLILLDVVLPGLTGFEIFQKATEEKLIKNIPVIFMTNLDSSDDDKKALKQATDYWIKSNMTPPEFLDKVKAVLK